MSTALEEAFTFNECNASKVKEIFDKYPEHNRRSAVLPLLTMAQEQNGGWLSGHAIEYVAGLIGIPTLKVYELASFYTMYNLSPVGAYHIKVCRTTPCWLMGSDKIHEACKNKINLLKNEHESKIFTLSETECLGACVNAPVVQINSRYYEDLNTDKISNILDDLIKKA